ncbi:MAG TPA: hypothetical protein VJN62_08410 [Gemmatimonadales bacterium]|nr:hypothetical protein [Gemmatimonadales bacterium]
MRKLWLGLFVAVAAVLSCNSPTGSSLCGNGNFFVIKADDNRTFTPQHATVAQGQQVCFENTGSIVHSVVTDSMVPADSTWGRKGEQGLAPGFPVIIQVGVGQYYYHCGIHGFVRDTTAGMWGEITVR